MPRWPPEECVLRESLRRRRSCPEPRRTAAAVQARLVEQAANLGNRGVGRAPGRIRERRELALDLRLAARLDRRCAIVGAGGAQHLDAVRVHLFFGALEVLLLID